MWQSVYRIAERQIGAGKYKKAEVQLKKALSLAEAASDKEQVAKTLSLLAILYLEAEKDAIDTLRKSVEAAEVAFGANSKELSEQLALLATVLEQEESPDEAESTWLQAIAVEEGREDPERLLEYLDGLIELYLNNQDYKSAEPVFIKALDLRKRIHGPGSPYIADQVETYRIILSGLDRKEEVDDLENALHSCHDCDSKSLHCSYDPEMKDVFEQLRETSSDGNRQERIKAYREGIDKLAEIHSRLSQAMRAGDPFREVRINALAAPLRSARTTLATLLRLQSQEDGSPEPLVEAVALTRKNIEEADLMADGLALVLLLLDLSLYDHSRYPELEQALDAAPDSAIKLYSRAIMLFRRQRSSSISRTAMEEALLFNPHVPVLMAKGFDPASAPNQYMLGDENEAFIYCCKAIDQWEATPGFGKFITDASDRILSKVMRNSSISPRELSLLAHSTH